MTSTPELRAARAEIAAGIAAISAELTAGGIGIAARLHHNSYITRLCAVIIIGTFAALLLAIAIILAWHAGTRHRRR